MPIQFEVENIDGKIKISPESLLVNKPIGLIRTISSIKDKENKTPFKYKGEEYKKILIHAYGSLIPVNMAEFIFTDYLHEKIKCKLFVEDIKDFDFSELPEKETLTVIMFEYTPINPPRKLFKNEG